MNVRYNKNINKTINTYIKVSYYVYSDGLYADISSKCNKFN